MSSGLFGSKYKLAPDVEKPWASDNVITRGFSGGANLGSSSQSIAEFYEALDGTQKKYNSLKQRTNNADLVGVGNLLSSNPLLEQQMKLLGDGSKALTVLRKEWRMFRVVEGISPEQRADILHQLDAIISRTALEYMDANNALEEAARASIQ